jgi:hypothetical protein
MGINRTELMQHVSDFLAESNRINSDAPSGKTRKDLLGVMKDEIGKNPVFRHELSSESQDKLARMLLKLV